VVRLCRERGLDALVVIGGAHAILIPEIPYDIASVVAAIDRRERDGHHHALVEAELAALTGKECRGVVLGHLLRGGSPSAFDRVCASRFGAAAVRALADGQAGVMVALGWKAIDLVPLAQVAGRTKTVQVDGHTVATARELGISLGDRPEIRHKNALR